jgi:hypothetical protein
MPTLNNDQFLVLRRDGSVASDVFVLDPGTNRAASAALQAFASAAETFGLMEPREAEAFRVLAAEWGELHAIPERKVIDRPHVVAAITHPETVYRVEPTLPPPKRTPRK